MSFFLSKKILTLGVKVDPPPHPKAVQLQKMIRYNATLFVQVRQEVTFHTESDITHKNDILIKSSTGKGTYFCLD